MTNRLWRTWVGVAALAVLGLVAATVAAGAGTTKHGSATTTGTTTTSKPARTPETPLTGDTLAKVTAAATAKVGGTVDQATTENDSSNAAAVYEAHVTKAGGTHVTVILDKDYAVLAVETGRGGPGGRHGGPGRAGSGETPLTGDVAANARAAAVAKVGGTADAASTENDSSNSAAAYEVHVTKADGSHVKVILDRSFTVLGVETPGPGGHGGPGGPGGPEGFRHH
jgi:uncharacterized membrane protein YkoI